MREFRDPTFTADDRRWLAIRFKLHTDGLRKAFAHFRAAGIEPVLIKGWAVAREYPEPYTRAGTDVDLAVRPDDFDAARELVESEEGRKWVVDLHRGLRHLDTVAWSDLVANSRLADLEGDAIRILRPEDHFRVLVVHWLTDGGAYREKMADFYHLLRNNADSFDWSRCLDVVSETRRTWILKTVGLVESMLGRPSPTLPGSDSDRRPPAWLLDALEKEWASGVKLTALQIAVKDRRMLWQQLRKRFPPNPIQASIESEAAFDDSPRTRAQLRSLWIRTAPSMRRFAALYKGLDWKKH